MKMEHSLIKFKTTKTNLFIASIGVKNTFQVTLYANKTEN